MSMPGEIAPALGAECSGAIDGYPGTRIPKQVLAKGNYFAYAGRPASRG